MVQLNPPDHNERLKCNFSNLHHSQHFTAGAWWCMIHGVLFRQNALENSGKLISKISDGVRLYNWRFTVSVENTVHSVTINTLIAIAGASIVSKSRDIATQLDIN